MTKKWKNFWIDEDGIGTLEILLIIAVIVIIAIAFRKWIIKWLTDLFSKADSSIIGEINNIDSDVDRLGPGPAAP